MATLYIFDNNPHQEGEELCLMIDANQQIVEPVAIRPYSKIQSLQENNKTTLVIPSEKVGIFKVGLPKIDDKKARAAIPYSLEEHLAQPVSELHFSFSKQFYHDGNYLVIVIDKLYLASLKERLEKANVAIDEITIEWFALTHNSHCISTTSLQVNSEEFNGALTGQIAENYLSTHEDISISIFNDSNSSLETKLNAQEKLQVTKDTSFYLWVGQQLINKKVINLCQGEFKLETKDNSEKNWVKICAVLACSWLIILFGFNLVSLFVINSKIDDTDKKIAALYHSFFPEAKRVISPRFRISQLFDTGDSSKEDAIFWQLLNKLISNYDSKSVTIDDLRYRNKALSISLTANDFTLLENLKNKLQAAHLKVTQSQAATKDNKVVASMEISL